MSKGDDGLTVSERIEEVRQMIPPPPERAARKAYISKEDFARLLGISRSRVFAWTRAENPEHPDEAARARLAELSRGRYAPTDFAPRTRVVSAGSLEHRVASLEETVERLERHIFGEAASQDR